MSRAKPPRRKEKRVIMTENDPQITQIKYLPQALR